MCTSSSDALSSPRSGCCSLQGPRWESHSRRSAWHGQSYGRGRPTAQAGEVPRQCPPPAAHRQLCASLRRVLAHRYCAELTAAILQVGGLLHKQSNPGAATPASLYELFAPRAAVAANPFKLHLLQQQQKNQSDVDDAEPMLQLGLRGAFSTPARHHRAQANESQKQHFKSLTVHPHARTQPNTILTSGLTLNSLTTATHRTHR